MTGLVETSERPDRAFDWRVAVRDYRRRLRLSLAEVARRSGLSLSAVKSYENGARHPTRSALKAVTDALGMTAQQSNPIFAGAGYATNWRAIYHEAYGPRPVEWFTEEVTVEIRREFDDGDDIGPVVLRGVVSARP